MTPDNGRDLTVSIHGRRVRLSGRGAYVDEIASRDTVDDPVLTALQQLVRPNSVCFDIGANIGLTTIALSLLAPAGRVIAVEPGAETFGFLQQNVEQNGLKNVECVRALIGASGERRAFYHNALNPSGSTSMPVDKQVIAGDLQVMECLSLDQLAERPGAKPPDVVKIDAEGQEIGILRSAGHLIRSRRTTFVLEFNSHCLMNFGRINPADAIDEIRSLFPVVSRIEASGELTEVTDSYQFMYANVLQRGCVDNLVCGF
jgi:FkbM family methyltransferase